MTRKLLLIALTLALFISACSQAPQEVQTPSLEPQFGTAGDDLAVDVTVNKKFGYIYYIAGNFSENGDEAFLRRYNRDGSLSWERRGGEAFAEARAVATDTSGNAYLAWSDVGYTTRCYLSKLSPSGKLLMRKLLYAGSDTAEPIGDCALDLVVGARGDVYTVGNTVRKYNAAGTLLWERNPSNRGARFTGIAIARSGNVVAVSDNGLIAKYSPSGTQLLRTTRSYFTEDDPRVALGPNEEIFVSYQYDEMDGSYPTGYIEKYSPQGQPVWRDSVYYNSRSSRVDADSKGNAYFTGGYDRCTFDSECSGRTDADAFVRKYAPDGRVLYTRLFGTFKEDAGRALALYSDDELYVLGETTGNLAEPNKGGTDLFLRKMDGSGNRVWTR